MFIILKRGGKKYLAITFIAGSQSSILIMTAVIGFHSSHLIRSRDWEPTVTAQSVVWECNPNTQPQTSIYTPIVQIYLNLDHNNGGCKRTDSRRHHPHHSISLGIWPKNYMFSPFLPCITCIIKCLFCLGDYLIDRITCLTLQSHSSQPSILCSPALKCGQALYIIMYNVGPVVASGSPLCMMRQWRDWSSQPELSGQTAELYFIPSDKSSPGKMSIMFCIC